MKNILVVDDELNIRTSLARELRDYQFNIIPAETGLVGLSKLEKQKVDLILLDLDMPIMNGIEFAEQVSKEFSYLPIVILSGNITKTRLADLMSKNKNIIDVLAKPWDHEKLIAILENAI